MSLESFLNIAACVALILFGLYAVMRPFNAAVMAHLKPDDATGTAEVRINFGTLSLMMGIAPLLLNDPVAYQVVGIVFLGAFVTRLITVVVDHPPIERLFVMSGVFELAVGLILLIR